MFVVTWIHGLRGRKKAECVVLLALGTGSASLPLPVTRSEHCTRKSTRRLTKDSYGYYFTAMIIFQSLGSGLCEECGSRSLYNGGTSISTEIMDTA